RSGLPSHIIRCNIFLNTQLPERGFGQGKSTSWSPLTPNLTPLNSFLRAFVKDEVNIPPVPLTLNNMKGRTQKVTANTANSCLQNVFAGQHKD
ncbi:hypothetical protein Cfor_09014, partial [Coptotermes formosanus]